MTPRLHAAAWWLWALALAVTASRTTNPLLLLLIVCVAACVVAARRSAAPWGRAFGYFVKLGVVIIVIRTLFAVIFAGSSGGDVLWVLPVVPLPGWLSGITLGGSVSAQLVIGAFSAGLQLATILICVGAANSLASPSRLLKSVPAALYELGVAVVVAITFAPQLISDLLRLRAVRKLRGRPTRGLRGLVAVTLPVIEGALSRSITLAAAMDARGYGRLGDRSSQLRYLTAGLLLLSLTMSVIGIYGFLDASAPLLLGLPLLVLGLAAGLSAVALGSRGAPRTRYRPDNWGWREWATVLSAMVPAVIVSLYSAWQPLLMSPTWQPLSWTVPPLVTLAAVLVAVLPAWVSPDESTNTAKQLPHPALVQA